MLRKNYLRAKTSVPRVLHTLLPRRTIASIIDGASLDEAVCLVAPYGYGKTLAVVSWLRERGENAAWLTLDETDNAKSSLYAGLSAAILRLVGGDINSDDILADPGYVEDPEKYLWESVSAAERSGAGKILVMDNLRFITGQESLACIKNTIQMLLGRWRVILISTSEPPPLFNDLMLRRNIYLITINELAFRPDEIEEFFRINNCPASREDAVTIYGETEGWPVSLNVVLTLSRGGPVVYTEAAREFVKVFFETEIWKYLDETTREFLMKTSILDRLTPGSCNAVTDMGATLPMLRRLFAKGMFVSRLCEKDTFRYHQVFRSFLLDRLKLSDIDEREIYKLAGWWHYERGEYEQAFRYFYEARELNELSQVLMSLNPATIGGIEAFIDLVGCITELDPALLTPYPLILTRIGLIYFLLGDISKMRALLDQLVAWSEPGVLPISSDEYGEFLWELGFLLYLDPNEPTINRKHLDWINIQSKLPHIHKLLMDRMAVMCFPTMLRGVRDYGADGLSGIETTLARAEAGEKNLLDLQESVWLAYLLEAEYYYELERFAEAEKIVRHIMVIAEEHKYTFMYFMGTTLLTKIIRAKYKYAEIEVLASRLGQMILANNDTFLLPNFHAFEMQIRLYAGVPGFTEIFLEENSNFTEKPYFYLIYRHFTYVRGLLSTGNNNEALVMLGNLELLCEKNRRPTDLIEVNLLKAVALHALEDVDGARHCLVKAIAGARKSRLIRIISDNAVIIWPVLSGMGGDAGDAFVKHIVISCKKTLARAGHGDHKKEQVAAGLTKTELKILRTLHTDMSYEEIAFDNNIKVSTVKTHIHSIYAKLDVSNRTSAVVVAKNMKLIE